jgi:PAS domain S-box-containing protein
VEKTAGDAATGPALTGSQMLEVFDLAPFCIAGVGADWTFIYANQPARELLGVPDLLGQDIFKLFPGNLQEPFYSAYQTTMAKRVPSEFEAYHPAPLNRWLKVVARPLETGMVVFFQDITEMRVAEQALHFQHDLLGTIQHTARMATWDLDPRAGAISFGPGSYPVFGHPLASITTLDELVGIVAPEHRERVHHAVAATLVSRYFLALDFKVLAEDGSTIWIEARGRAIEDEAGAPSRIGAVAIDITARKRSEEALAASEERYRILADLNPQAIWMGAPDGRITYANQGFLDYIGLTTESLDNMGWLNVFHPDDHKRVIEAWGRSVATGEEYNIEARIIRARDLVPRLWWLRGLPVRGESGAILHWLGVAIDIEDARSYADALFRKQQETERQRAELETIYQTAPIGLALFSPIDFRFLRINDRMVEIIGLAREDIVGQPLAEIAPIPGLQEILRTVNAGTPVRELLLEGELPARPGEMRVWTVNHTPVFNNDGSIQAITASWLEITHQKKAESALVQSEKLAAVGRLASSISHEINNPLEAITNLLYLIAHTGELPEELKVYVHMAQAELSRVSQIATQTLRFHRQAVKPTAVTPGELVDAVLNLYQGRLANSGIRVETRYSSRTRILCFENDIRQVLNNLIANAIDAMRTGGRLIARAHDAVDGPTGRKGVRITIADTGHGMSQAVMARVFEPFYTTKDLNGTGLGLWISAGIVQRHQGRLTVRSSEQRERHGSVFSLFLPCEEEAEAIFADAIHSR